MRDYAKIAEALRYCSTHICNTHCGYYEICHRERQDKYASNVNIGFDAADAIEELLARVSDTNVGKCKDCATQHIDPDGMRWCEELSTIVADDFYCGYWEKPAPPKGVE